MNYIEMLNRALVRANAKLEELETIRDTAYDTLYQLEVAEPYDDDGFEEQNDLCGELDSRYNDLLNLVERLETAIKAINELHTEYRMNELEELGK